MMFTPARIIIAVVATIAIVIIAVALAPLLDRGAAVRKEQAKDAVASGKIEAKGEQATTKDVAAGAAVQEKARAQVEYVTRTVRLSPTAATPIPADRLDRLRTADRELCKLGVRCVGSGDRP